VRGSFPRVTFVGSAALEAESLAGLGASGSDTFSFGPNFLTVLDAERSALTAEDQLALSQTQTATALLATYKALGGGFRPLDKQAKL